jgi:glucose/arabinose dehydrogenase
MGGHLLRTPAITALLALLIALAVAGPATASTLPTGFEDQPLVSGLWFPTGEAWAPNGRMYVIQKDGEVFTVAPGSSIPQPLINIANQVNFYGDRGLLGVAVDSDFANSNVDHHYLYLLYTHRRPGMTSQSGEPANSQLLRVRLNAAGDQVLSQQVILGTASDGIQTDGCPAPANGLDCIPSDSDTHSIGTVRSAPDGTLFVGSGDGAGWTAVDLNALRTYNEQSLSGKILHLDRDGHGLPGHPFCPADSNLGDVCTKLYAKGFRNPYRFKLQPGGGLTVGDVGWSEREEIDLISSGGRNYGWPCYEGAQHTPGYRELDACQAEYDKEPNPSTRDVLPDVDYPHRDPDDPNPPSPSGNTVLGGPTYQGNEYPPSYLDKIFVGDYSTEEIWTLEPHPSGGPTLASFGTDMGPIVDIDTAPDGNLVYTSLGDFSATGGSIQEISHPAQNHSPVADARSDGTSGVAPFTVHFDGSQSSDPDDDALTYHWDFGDGASSDQTSPAHEYTGAGHYTAKLTVTDPGNKTGSDGVILQVGAPPSISGITPSTAKYRDGVPVTLTASATDDGPLPDSSYTWQLLIRHHSHFHQLTAPTGHQITFTPPTDHDEDAYADITLTVTDADGLVATKNMQLNPETVPFNLISEPAGAPMDYAGRSVSGPFHKQSAIGFEGSVSTAQGFSTGGHDYLFEGWDGGGPRVHPFTVPDGGMTLTARYRDVTPTIIKPTPPPVLPPPDQTGPRLRFKKLDPRKGMLSGTVSDAAGVKTVYVALGHATEGRGCHWWVTSLGRLSRGTRSCSKPRWILAKLKGSSWTAKLNRKLVPPGYYRLALRAVDRLGNRTDTLRRERVKAAKKKKAIG